MPTQHLRGARKPLEWRGPAVRPSTAVCLGVSLLLHLLAVGLNESLHHRPVNLRRLRMRQLTAVERGIVRAAGGAGSGLRPQPEYRGPGSAPSYQYTADPWLPAPAPIRIPRPPQWTYVPGPRAPEHPQLPTETMPSPTRWDLPTVEEDDVFALVDPALVGRLRGRGAVVAFDPAAPAQARGFVHLTSLLLDGTGSCAGIDGPSWLAPLASYLSLETGVQAGLRGPPERSFRGKGVLQDPIHFFFPMPRTHRGPASCRVWLDDEEVETLGHYLRGGGFVYLESVPPRGGRYVPCVWRLRRERSDSEMRADDGAAPAAPAGRRGTGRRAPGRWAASSGRWSGSGCADLGPRSGT